MKEKGTGGANTKTGLVFEGKTDLATFLGQQKGYEVDTAGTVYYKKELVAKIFKKYKLYAFLREYGIDWNCDSDSTEHPTEVHQLLPPCGGGFRWGETSAGRSASNPPILTFPHKGGRKRRTGTH